MSALTQLQEFIQKENYYSHAYNLMYWDLKTLAPKNARAKLSDSIAFFSTKIFEMETGDELFNILNELSEPDNYNALSAKDKFIVTTMLEDCNRQKRIPADFYERYVRTTTESAIAWEEAKQNNDFTIFAPHLRKVIDATKQMVAYTNPDEDPYEALLSLYEKGMDSVTIDRLFTELKAELVPLIKKISNKPEPVNTIAQHSYDANDQRKVQELLLKYIGFSFDSGCVGESEHPFTLNMSSKDVRVTNHYYEHDPIDSMFSAIHEGGHAIFEQNVNPDYDGTVAGSCRYMGIHESQSRFFENILGRNINFWTPIYSQLTDILTPLRGVSIEDFYRAINNVKSSFIRTSADEVTYCLHIIIRYEIEKAIFRDNVDVDELPALWNAKMKEYLGIVPDNDAVGILQDMHWSDGSFGYFPSYLLGSIYDGMYLQAVEKELGSVDTILSEGRIKDITAWLNTNIHQYGSTRKPLEVIENVCHAPVSAAPIIKYFKDKYTKIYGLD